MSTTMLRGGVATGRWMAPLLLLVVLGFAAFSGLIIGYAGVYAAAFATAVVLFVAAMLLPVQMLFMLTMGIVFLVVGQLQYFARVDKAFWVPYLICLILYLRLVSSGAKTSAAPHAAPRGGPSGWPKAMLILSLVTAVAASAINAVPPLQWLIAGKEYFFLLSILLAFASGAVGVADFERVWRFVPWFLALQIPAVLYQRFYVATHRAGDSAFDAVVGLFGGDPQGGGASGAMATFSVIVMVMTLEAWRSGLTSRKRLVLTMLLALIPIFLAEVKFALLLMPVALLLVYGRELLRHPLRALVAVVVGAAFSLALLAVYQKQFTSDRTKEGRSLGDYVETIVERNFGAEQFNPRTREVGRVAAISLWARDQRWSDPTHALIGYGIGATRVGSLAFGEIAKRFQIRIGRSSLAILLWETGLIGAGAVVLGLLTSALAAFRLARQPALAQRAWLLRGSGIALLIVLMGLPYNTDFIEISQIQILAWCLVGCVVALSRSLASNHRTGRFKPAP
jgi:hypothetical protein